jgi:ATP-dependent protease HslVU (ClpYQ) peptidase subunit
MSTVLALKDKDSIILASDGLATTEDGFRRPIVADKIFKNGKYYVGYAGSIRTGQIFKNIELPDIEFLADFMLEEMNAKGCLATVENQVKQTEANFIFVYENEIYEMLVDFQLNKTTNGYTAIGSGSGFVFAALYLTEKFDLTPRRRCELALEAACNFDRSSSEPFTFVEIPFQEIDNDSEKKRLCSSGIRYYVPNNR